VDILTHYVIGVEETIFANLKKGSNLFDFQRTGFFYNILGYKKLFIIYVLMIFL
jgi:hypothetical protein